MAQKVILVTGANRGIGLGLVEAYLSRGGNTVIATVRDASKASSPFQGLRTGDGSKLIVAEISSTDHGSAGKAIESLKTKHGIDHIDVVIANAGIAKALGPLAKATPEALREHYEVNTLAPLALFQATQPLLEKSPEPTFIVISTRIGSSGLASKIPMQWGAYGQSKAAVNYIVAELASENKHINIFAIHPGWVQTDMGNAGAKFEGLESAKVTVDESIAGLLKRFDSAKLETTTGQFFAFDSEENIPW